MLHVHSKSEILAGTFFWPGLKQTDTIRNLRAHWLALRHEQRSIETAVDMVKHSASALDQHVGFVATCKPYKKDHWKSNSWYKKDYTRSNKKCYPCGNYGHVGKYCDANKSNKSRGWSPAPATIFASAWLSDCRFLLLVTMLDEC